MRAAIGLSLLVLSAGDAVADSDGLFCVAGGYVAYELREWSAPESKHVLKLIRVGGPAGIGEPVTVELENVQLHGMTCGARGIALSSWDATYVVDLPEKGAPRIASVRPHPPGQVPPGDSSAGRVTDSRRSRTFEIPATTGGNSYELQIVHREENRTTPGKGGVIRHHTTSKVVEKDGAGKAVRERQIFAGTSEETID